MRFSPSRPNVERWIDRLQERPAVQRALQVLADRRKPLTSPNAFSNLFGDNQFKKRASRSAV